MQRRKFLIGAGGTVIGASALIGSGAFSSATIERDVTIAVVPDAQAFLALKEGDHAGEYTETGDEGELVIDFTSTTEGGEGFNPEASFDVENLFEIKNQSSQDLDVTIEIDLPALWPDWFDVEIEGVTPTFTGDPITFQLDVGHSVYVSVVNIDTTIQGSWSGTFTIDAEAK